MSTAPGTQAERIASLCAAFNLSTVAAEVTARFVNAGHAGALDTLLEVLETEAEGRRQRRVTRLRRESKLLPGKTWDTLDHDRFSAKLKHQMRELAEGEFLDRGANLLAFGLPGTGKTHAVCAIGHRLIEAGRAVLFVPAYRIAQDLLAARRDLRLAQALRKFDAFDLLIIDDLGYLPQGASESEVLFTLMAERYERRSMAVTSNLVFSEWDKVFRSPMATAAAIDRIVHHSVILEFDSPSYRTAQAKLHRRKADAREPAEKNVG